MDFLKTLLAYMAATLVVAVESTSTPSVTPVPTPSPTIEPVETAIVETVTDVPTEVPTATPTATVSVTPAPVPTITPNTKAYHNLAQGDKGEEVRRLQEKLIELGYLPEGAADGSYGNQTRNAVRRFQYYNSLTVDGIAGRATQTNLFENPDIVPYPAQETPTPAVTETPSPVPPTDTPEPTDAPELTEVPELTETPESAGTLEVVSTPETAETETSAEEKTETAAPGEEKETAEPVEETPAADASEPIQEQPEEEAAQTQEEARVTLMPWREVAAAMRVAEAKELPETEDATPAPETEEPSATSVAEEETGAPETEEATVTPAAEEATETPEAAATEEIVEEVDLDETEEPEMTATPEPPAEPPVEYEDLAGWVVLNDSGESMQWMELEDGVNIIRSPRMQRHEDDIRVSLDDLCKSVESWNLTDEGHTLILEAQGYTLALLDEEAGFVSTVDGLEMFTEREDFDFSAGHFIRVDFLTRALDGSWEWDAEEETLMIRIPEKSESQYTD